MAQVSFVEGRHTPETRAALARGRGRTAARAARVRGRLVFARRAADDAQRHDDRRAICGGPTDRSGFAPNTRSNLVGPDYFSTMGIEVLGADASSCPTDRRGGPVVAVVNEEFVRRHFPARIRSGVSCCCPAPVNRYPAEIVGVVAQQQIPDDRRGPAGRDLRAIPAARQPRPFVHVLVRADQPTRNSAREDIERMLSSLDPTAAVDVDADARRARIRVPAKPDRRRDARRRLAPSASRSRWSGSTRRSRIR